MSESVQGWGWPSNSRKAHYFVEGRSLCGNWGWIGMSGLSDDRHESPDNCTACRKKRERAANSPSRHKGALTR